MAEGACRRYPATAFFPSDGAGVEAARAICDGCAVAARCLDYALEQRIEHGVWGGASERQRRRILRGRRREAKEAAARVAATSVR
jgi:WhiB family redox-sensing transcriptional regulator